MAVLPGPPLVVRRRNSVSRCQRNVVSVHTNGSTAQTGTRPDTQDYGAFSSSSAGVSPVRVCTAPGSYISSTMRRYSSFGSGMWRI
jgi:hypothetical protein